jgi:hypothetical protein
MKNIILLILTILPSLANAGKTRAEFQNANWDDEKTWNNWDDEISRAGLAPNEYRRVDCPVVGNTQTGIYHTPGQPNYRQMLVVNKAVSTGAKDNRRCFDNEDEAKETDYYGCPEDQDGGVPKCAKTKYVHRTYVKAKN